MGHRRKWIFGLERSMLVISMTLAACGTSPNGSQTVTDGSATGGYREVDSGALVQFAADGTTTPISDPLADGNYYAATYALTADGTGVRFDLSRFISADTCLADPSRAPDADDLDCLGGVIDDTASAVVTLGLDSTVPIVLVNDDYRFVAVTPREFGRLLAGETAAADAPTWFTYQPYWDALVRIEDGAVVQASQRPSS